MFKKIHFLLVLLLPLVFTSCGGTYLALVKDDVSPEYIKSEYSSSIQCFEYSSGFYETLIDQMRLSVKEDADTPDAEKKILLNRIKEFEKYEDNRFFGVIITKGEPLPRKNLNLKFSILTANKTQLLSDVVSFYQKITFVSNYGSWPEYRYFWFIKSNIPINAKNIKDVDKPVNMIISYPNGQNQIYSIIKK